MAATAAELDEFFAGKLPSTEDERLAFIRAHRGEVEFKKRSWPWFAAFVDASNVSRVDRPDVHEVTRDKAQVKYLLSCEAALRKLGYIPIMVADGNLRRIIDEPWTYEERWGKYPHSTAAGVRADFIVLRALRSLPEAVCVSNDRFRSPDELEKFGDVLADRSRFWHFAFDAEGTCRLGRGDEPMPGASRRLARILGARAAPAGGPAR